MLLSGLTETYVLTIFFVLLLILFALTKKSTRLSDNVIFAILTGTTLTNCIYFFFVKVCEKAGDIKQAVTTTFKSTYLFIPLFVITMTGLAFRYFVKHIPLMEAILNDMQKHYPPTLPYSITSPSYSYLFLPYGALSNQRRYFVIFV